MRLFMLPGHLVEKGSARSTRHSRDDRGRGLLQLWLLDRSRPAATRRNAGGADHNMSGEFPSWKQFSLLSEFALPELPASV